MEGVENSSTAGNTARSRISILSRPANRGEQTGDLSRAHNGWGEGGGYFNLVNYPKEPLFKMRLFVETNM